jgi:hypothetical protein
MMFDVQNADFPKPTNFSDIGRERPKKYLLLRACNLYGKSFTSM